MSSLRSVADTHDSVAADVAHLKLATARQGSGVCRLCFNLISPDRVLCRACSLNEGHLELMVPISYSLGGGPLHMALAGYKRDADPFVPRALTDLAAIIQQFLITHELCVGAGRRFDVVTTVPSGDAQRDQLHPLRRLIGELVDVTAARHRRLLCRSAVAVAPHRFDPHLFEPLRALHGERVLLIDDMWTTGASAQSAAAALLRAGAGCVAAVVVGRHLNRGWRDNRDRFSALVEEFDWSACALCAPNQHPAAQP